MSRSLISRSPDLTRLQDDGLVLEIVDGYLVVHNVPYVNDRGELAWGALISELTLAGDVTAKPGKHLAYFAGDYPCDKEGNKLRQIEHKSQNLPIRENLVARHSFSSKPKGGYADYYEKMRTYYTIIAGPAESKFPEAAKRPPLITYPASPDSVFHYLDTASSRANINTVTRKLAIGPVAIIGLGGTGAYVLDLLAKTPVSEIHMFDDDAFLQHNAFRAPGAPSIETLRSQPRKVDYYRDIYSRMRRGIVAHPNQVTAENVACLATMAFVFLCVDNGDAKSAIITHLLDAGVPVIDVGMGVKVVDDALCGIVRVTAATPDKHDHIEQRIGFTTGPADNAYRENIQLADLNMLNAALAVIKWKKLCGFHHDFEGEHFSAYTIDGNTLTNEDKHETGAVHETRVSSVRPR